MFGLARGRRTRRQDKETLVAYNKGYLDGLEYAIIEIRVLD